LLKQRCFLKQAAEETDEWPDALEHGLSAPVIPEQRGADA
jgi:hypothetical protein